MSTYDPTPILAQLKDFQQATVHHVMERLYDPAGTRRFLVADEVGLGKTLVARGVVASTVQLLQERGVGRVDVLYVCSNAEIARQNLARLNLFGREDIRLADRITLLPLTAGQLNEHAVNIISFTPKTSFDLKSKQGNQRERAVLVLMLQHIWGPDVVKGAPAFRVFQGGVAHTRSFQWTVAELGRTNTLDESLVEAFGRRLDELSDERVQRNQPSIREEFEALRHDLRRLRSSPSGDLARRRREFVGLLRAELARVCIGALQPDLVILDEFQRFKALLDPDSEDGAAELARSLFQHQDAYTGMDVRVLLLSATPYKMYTLDAERAEDDHYRDFVQTVRFLLDDDEATKRFEGDLRRFREGLLQLAEDDGHAARLARRDVEATLRGVMCRTERLAVTPDRGGMLRSVSDTDVTLTVEDLQGYLLAERISRRLGAPDPLELWKSAPFLLNFIDGYAIARLLDEEAGDAAFLADLQADLERAACTLDPASLRRFESLDAGNARLRSLAADVIGSGLNRLLWMPPSLPYHQPAGPFAAAGVKRATKRLVFSSWKVAPRAIASILSYLAECDLVRTHGEPPFDNSPEGRATRTALLSFRAFDGRLSGMPVLALLYPSTVLARLGDPRSRAASHGTALTVDQVLALIAAEIREELAAVVPHGDEGGREDERWYWAAPLLLDRAADLEATDRFWRGHLSALAKSWEGENADRSSDRFVDHLQQARSVVRDQLDPPLGRPPADLADVLALIALAGPAGCAARALSRIAGGTASLDRPSLRAAAARAAWGLRSLFNAPEVMAAIHRRGQTPYWQEVLEYAAGGNLQAVLDEYLHVLPSDKGFVGELDDTALQALGEHLYAMASLRTSTTKARMPTDAAADLRLRNSFAMRLSDRDEQSTGDDRPARAAEVRQAFNSPFWPFVLASTSIGQEGLDFHQFCHAVVHWNLPANPVDLEQREGRVHRFKGHAVRRNVALRHGDAAFDLDEPDPWAAMFDAARADRPPGDSDLVPYWVLPVEGGACIERHVPALALSRDKIREHRLTRTLAAYRMAFGQPRQEELMAYLDRIDPERLAKLADELRVDLSPGAAGGWDSPRASA